MGLARHPQLLTGIVSAVGNARRKNNKNKSGEDGEKFSGGKVNKGPRCHVCGSSGHKQDSRTKHDYTDGCLVDKLVGVYVEG